MEIEIIKTLQNTAQQSQTTVKITDCPVINPIAAL